MILALKVLSALILLALASCTSAMEQEARLLGEKRCKCDQLKAQNDQQALPECMSQLQTMADEVIAKYRDAIRDDEAQKKRWLKAQNQGYEALCGNTPTEQTP